MKKKLVVAMMCAAMMTSMAAAAPAYATGDITVNADDPDVSITMSHNSGEETVLNKAAEFFKEKVEEYSQGKITVDIYPNGSLMDVKQTNEAIKDGTIQMSAGSPNSSISTALGIMELPNLVNSEESCHELVQPGTDFRYLLDGLMQDAGMNIISLEPCNFRMMTSNKEAKSYEELAGVDIRVMDNPVPMSYWKQWGANPTPIAWAETYISIQQGLVDAQENPYDSIIAGNLFEVQKYLIETNHVMFYTGLYMNSEFYNSLPDNYKAIIDKAGVETDAFAYDLAVSSSAEKEQFLVDKGMTVIKFTDDDYAKMRANASEADNLVKEAVGEDVFNKAMAALGF